MSTRNSNPQNPTVSAITDFTGFTAYGTTALTPLRVDPTGTTVQPVSIVSGGGTNPAAGTVGDPVPVSASYTGVDVSGDLQGVTGHAPGSVIAMDVQVVDNSGNPIVSFGSGVQYTGSPAESAGSVVSTLVSGYDGTNVRPLLTDDTGVLQTAVTGTVTVSDGTNNIFTITHPGYIQGSVAVSGTVSATQGTSPWVVSNSGTFAVQAAQSGSWTVHGTGTFTTQDVSDGTPGMAVPATALQVAGSDGTDLRTISVDATGKLNVNATNPSVGTTGAATPTSATLVGATDGTDLQPLKVNGSGFLETVISAALPAGSAVIGHVITDTGSTTAVTGTVTVVQGTGSNLHVVVDSGTITVAGSTNIFEVSPTTAANTASNPFFNGLTDGMNGVVAVKAASTVATTSDPSLVVQISPNQPSSLGTSGSALPAKTTVIAGSDGTDARSLLTSATGQLHSIVDSGSIQTVAGTSGGYSAWDIFGNTLTDTSQEVKSSAGQFYGYGFFNPNAVVVYLMIYSASETCGSATNRVYCIGIVAGGTANVEFSTGIACGTTIYAAISTAVNSAAAPSTQCVGTLLYS